MSLLDADSVATDADLAVYTLGADELSKLLPEDRSSAKFARQAVLDQVLLSLSKRRPAIRASDLIDATELRVVVCYGTLEILYRGAIQHEDSPNVGRYKTYQKLYAEELNALQPSVISGATGSSLSIRMSRG